MTYTFGVKADSTLFLDYYEKFFTDIFFPEIRKKNIDTIIIPGDIFDRRKYINFVTLKRAREMFFDKLVIYDLKTYAIYGNHDIYYRNTDNVSSIDLLLGEYKNHFKVLQKPTTLSIKDTKFCFIPWIQQENEYSCLNEIASSDASICVGHFEIAGFLMHSDSPVTSHGLERNIFKKYENVISGHFHHKSSDGKINYVGNPFETTWSDFEDPKGFHILNLDTKYLDFIQNPYKMFHKLVYDDVTDYHKSYKLEDFKNTSVKVVVLNKSDNAKFERFMERLTHVGPFEISIIENFLEIDEDMVIDETKSTTGMMNDYIDSLKNTGSIDKEKLKTVFKEIYTEAINIEEEE